MKTNLLNRLILTISIGLTSLFGMNAQVTHNFTSDNSGFTGDAGANAFGSTLTHDIVNGYVDVTYPATSKNAVMYQATNIDADTYKYVKLIIKNTSSQINLISIRAKIGGTSWKTNTLDISNNDTEFQTYYIPLTDETKWAGSSLLHQVIFKKSDNTVITDGGTVTVDFIQFYEGTTSYSDFSQNSAFDDAEGIIDPWYVTNHNNGTVSFSTDEKRSGSQSLSVSFPSTPGGTQWIFSTYVKDFGSTMLNTDILTASIWVKVVRTGLDSPLVTLSSQFRTGTTDVIGDMANKADNSTTINTNGAWEELTFSISPNADYQYANFRIAVTNPNILAGDVIYIDDITTTRTGVLSNESNQLEDVNIYPNPVEDELSVKAPLGSEITIFNTAGQNVKNTTSSGSITKISVNEIPSGLYIVKISNNGKTYNQKVVVK
jgi:hypothetical protein